MTDMDDSTADTAVERPPAGQAEPEEEPQEGSSIANGETTPPTATTKPSLWTRTITAKAGAITAGIVLAAGLLGGTTIGFVSRPAVATTGEFKAMKDELNQQLSDTESDLGIATDNLDAANQHIADVKDREAALVAGESKLKSDQAALDQRTQQVESTQFSDGIHLIGTNVTPGIYSISDSSSCYYVWKTGTGSDADIIDNNIVSGPATVTLKAGDTFETNRCGTWTKVG
jgi:hypothetical protein